MQRAWGAEATHAFTRQWQMTSLVLGVHLNIIPCNKELHHHFMPLLRSGEWPSLSLVSTSMLSLQQGSSPPPHAHFLWCKTAVNGQSCPWCSPQCHPVKQASSPPPHSHMRRHTVSNKLVCMFGKFGLCIQ